MGLGTTELLLICGLALLLFGGGKIAEIGKGLGNGIRNFKQGLRASDDDEIEDSPKKEPSKKPTPG
ncbi:MAG: twin-arginine translocase TatA/TatE family subunit [Deltaproteobacteria bacterium]|nr:twin-arginine translocase TatA/TatE family subunit [Deltaproteobacteria bacterium]